MTVEVEKYEEIPFEAYTVRVDGKSLDIVFRSESGDWLPARGGGAYKTREEAVESVVAEWSVAS